MNEIIELLKWSPPVLLVLALNMLGMAIKQTEAINNKWIPLILMAVGGVVYCGIGQAHPLPYVDKLDHPWMIYAVIGVIAGGLAVGAHKLVKKYFPGLQNGDAPKTTTQPTP